MRRTDFLRWLDRIPDGADVDAQVDLRKRPRAAKDEDLSQPRPDGLAKRRRCDPCRADFRTPPLSRSASRQMDHGQDSARREATTPPDAALPSHGAVANDDTPRATLVDRPRHRQLDRHMSTSRSSRSSRAGSSASSDKQTTGSQPSSTGRKRKRNMKVAPDRVNIKTFATGVRTMLLPPRLGELDAAFKKSWAGCVSSSRYTEIMQAEAPFNDIAAMPESAFFAAPPPEHQGRPFEAQESPSLADVVSLLAKAAQCEEDGWDEAGWNMAVHYPLMRLAVPDGSQLEVTPCITAQIQPRFQPLSTSSSRVDYCITINPHWPHQRGVDTPALRAITERQFYLPERSISHTSYEPLISRPIAVSIETKRPDGSPDEAIAQLGIWQAAQWRMLEELAPPLPPALTGPADLLAASPSRPPYLALHGVDFLPAVYIVGHEWKFAALTRDAAPATDSKGMAIQSQSTLWTNCLMGDTSSVHGIYRIIWCLRRLARYSMEEFWPWYQRHVLRMDFGG
ncbi:hypothetical protein RB601_005780 [Gaeumannomyces tritici]